MACGVDSNVKNPRSWRNSNPPVDLFHTFVSYVHYQLSWAEVHPNDYSLSVKLTQAHDIYHSEVFVARLTVQNFWMDHPASTICGLSVLSELDRIGGPEYAVGFHINFIRAYNCVNCTTDRWFIISQKSEFCLYHLVLMVLGMERIRSSPSKQPVHSTHAWDVIRNTLSLCKGFGCRSRVKRHFEHMTSDLSRSP